MSDIIDDEKDFVYDANAPMILNLTKYEWRYLGLGITLLTIGTVVQFGALAYLYFPYIEGVRFINLGSFAPLAAFLIYLIPASFLHWIMVKMWAAGAPGLADAWWDTFGVTKFPLFVFHGGIVIIVRCLILVIVRIFVKNWHRDEFYIFAITHPNNYWK